MQVIATRPDVYLLNIIQEFLIWRTLAITFTTHAKIFVIYLNSKMYFFLFMWCHFISIELLLPDYQSIARCIGFYEPVVLRFGLF